MSVPLRRAVRAGDLRLSRRIPNNGRTVPRPDRTRTVLRPALALLFCVAPLYGQDAAPDAFDTPRRLRRSEGP